MSDPAFRRRDPFRLLLARALEHPVMRYRTGAEAAYLVTDPDLIKHVLADNAANYSKATAINGVFKRAVADGLLTSEGPLWRRQRRLMQPAFHRERLAALGSQMSEATVRMLERWEGVAERGEVVDVAEEMSSLTMQITAKALFGADISGEVDSLGRRIAESVRILVAPDRPEFQEAYRHMNELVSQILDERLRTSDRGVDLLAMLIEARDEETGQGMSRRQLLDEIITLILAGYETTANALAWTWFLLSENLHAAEALRAELRSVLDGRVPATADLPSLPYSRMVLEESLRLYPPAWIMGRRALGDDRLGEQEIPAGSVVAISPYLVHRHPDYWDNAEAFHPERFGGGGVPGKAPFAYIPFGGGPRLCIGHNFAMLEAQLIIATVAQRYRLELVGGQAVEPERLFVLRPRGGLPMILRPV